LSLERWRGRNCSCQVGSNDTGGGKMNAARARAMFRWEKAAEILPLFDFTWACENITAVEFTSEHRVTAEFPATVCARSQVNDGTLSSCSTCFDTSSNSPLPRTFDLFISSADLHSLSPRAPTSSRLRSNCSHKPRHHRPLHTKPPYEGRTVSRESRLDSVGVDKCFAARGPTLSAARNGELADIIEQHRVTFLQSSQTETGHTGLRFRFGQSRWEPRLTGISPGVRSFGLGSSLPGVEARCLTLTTCHLPTRGPRSTSVSSEHPNAWSPADPWAPDCCAAFRPDWPIIHRHSWQDTLYAPLASPVDDASSVSLSSPLHTANAPTMSWKL
jgi:hypothetical protein